MHTVGLMALCFPSDFDLLYAELRIDWLVGKSEFTFVVKSILYTM